MSDSAKTRWYKNAVIYQIYPRSFSDSNDDGIGDIKGIISKLDYIKELGVDAVWLSPCYKSPNDDNGYDISDYRDIMDDFGCLDDWKKMTEGLHKRGIKLVMDLVANHTSDEHFWFVESKKSKDNPYRDYYIWKEGNGKKPPNNWCSRFVGSAWKKDEASGEYYLHLFSKKQPDLNWDNPKVREEVADICEYWFNLGVDGFRCDVITYISKPADYRNSKMLLSPLKGDDVFSVGENWHRYIRELCVRSWDKHDSYIVGESPGISLCKIPSMIAEEEHVMDGTISFEHVECDTAFGFYPRKFNLRKLKKVFSDWQGVAKNCNPTLYLENHDQPRVVSRFGSDLPAFREVSAKSLATMLFFLRGTTYIYQGQEIGMTNCPLAPDEFRDIMSINILKACKKFKPLYNHACKLLNKKARDNARTPMQWNSAANAGFSSVTPWMKVNPNFVDINIEAQKSDKLSVLNYYKELIKLKKKYVEIISNGNYKTYGENDKNLYTYTMALGDKTIIVVSSFSQKEVSFVLPKGLDYERSTLLISNNKNANRRACNTKLLPYEARVYLLEKE